MVKILIDMTICAIIFGAAGFLFFLGAELVRPPRH